MKPLSWRRGFYRLWIVATVVWLVGVIVMLRPDAAVVDYFVRTYNSSVEDKYDRFFTQEYYDLDRDRVTRAALIGIVPALGVLAIGEVLGWAIRGFRARPS